MKDERILKVIFTTGGTKSVTNKMSLPSTWVREMGITEDDREIKVTFDGEKIIVEKL